MPVRSPARPPGPTTPGRPDPDVAPLVLHPAARVLWRTDRLLQLELGTRSVVVDGLDHATIRALVARPAVDGGSGARPHVVDAHVRSALWTLADAGFLWTDEARATASPPVPRLAADLAALSVRHGAEGPAVLRARRERHVVVHGTGRLAAGLAALLGAAGVGTIGLVGSGPVSLHAIAPGGVRPEDEGRPFVEAAADAVLRAAPEVLISRPHADPYGDLTVLTGDEPVEQDLRDELHDARAPHLVVSAHAERGVVGPMVTPSRTSCLRCADLHRQDRDHAWSALAVQLPRRTRHAPPVDIALAAAVTGLAAVHVLAHLDRPQVPEPAGTAATENGTLELTLPDWRLRRRSWPAHPDCECGAG